MSIQPLYLFLTLHLMGLAVMAGTTVVDYITFLQFCRMYEGRKEKAMVFLGSLSMYSRIIGIGAAVLVLSGVGMMAVTGGAFGEQLWFRIKIVLVLLLIIGSLITGRRQLRRLSAIVSNDARPLLIRTLPVKTTLNRFYVVRLVLFIAIIVLSVYKFN